MNPLPAAATISTGAMALRVVLALGLVLGIFAAVLYLYRRATRGGSAPRRPQRIEILAQRSLGTRTSLALVQVAGETLLIGVTPQQITALGPVALETDAEAMRALLMAPAQTAVSGASGASDARFAQTLQTELTRVRRAIEAPANAHAGTRAQRPDARPAVEV